MARHISLGVDLIRLVIPKEPPHTLYQGTDHRADHRGAFRFDHFNLRSGDLSSEMLAGPPIVRLALGGLALAAAAITLSMIAAPSAAVGPGGGAITWAETTRASALTVLAVCLLRAVATTASAAVGGCGGLFVPFMAIGDLAGRVFSPSLGVPDDLAGAAGAAGGISGGYHLPVTAVALVLGQGGPNSRCSLAWRRSRRQASRVRVQHGCWIDFSAPVPPLSIGLTHHKSDSLNLSQKRSSHGRSHW